MLSYRTKEGVSDRDRLRFKKINANLAHGNNVHIATLVRAGDGLRSEETSFLLKEVRRTYERWNHKAYLSRIPMELNCALGAPVRSDQRSVSFQDAHGT